MFNAERLLGQLIKNKVTGKRNRMSWGTKAGIGMGVFGVALAAFEHFQEQEASRDGAGTATPPPTPGASSAMAGSLGSEPTVPPPLPPGARRPTTEPSEQSNQDSLLLIRAMIAAAAADGLVDEEERSRITKAAQDSGLGAEELELLAHELEHPLSIDRLVAAVTRDELRSQVYGVSLLAVDVDTDAEQDYFNRLAVALQLDDDTVQQIRAEMEG